MALRGEPVQRTKGGYNYVDLRTAYKMSHGEQVNVFGIVTEWDDARRTKATDWMKNFGLIDISLLEEDMAAVKSIKMSVFSTQRDLLPRVLEVGDIIRVHRAHVEHYKNKSLIVASVTETPSHRSTHRSSFCVFRAKPRAGENPMQPYHLSSKTYHYDDRVGKIIEALREYSTSGVWRSAPLSSEQVKYRRLLRNIISSSEEGVVFADVVALVIQVERNPKSTSANVETCLWVWDGTDMPPYPQATTTTTSDVAGSAEDGQIGWFPFKLQGMEEDRQILGIPAMGTIVPIFVRNPEVVDLPSPGNWIRLRNCGFCIVAGQLQGVLTPRSKWLVQNEEEELLSLYEARIELNNISAWAPTDPDSWATRAEQKHRNKPMTSLRQVAIDAHVNGSTPKAFRSIVRVYAVWPSLSNLQAACVQSSACGKAAEMDGYRVDGEEWLYAMRFRLYDGTGTFIDANLFGKDGTNFFKHILPPQDLGKDEKALERLTAAVTSLLGGSNTRELQSTTTTWLEVCLQAYVPDGPSSSDRPCVRYRIFDTYMKPTPR